jgi:probable F420-dependent oxidoreductase
MFLRLCSRAPLTTSDSDIVRYQLQESAGFGYSTTMRFGIVTPIVTMAPRTHAAWEEDAGPEEIRAIAVLADRLGYSHLTCSEHVGIPAAAVAVRGGRYYDPAATLGFVAAVTQRIRLLTHVVVLPYHHPLAIAKRYGTLDRLSGGRLILGVGVGSLEEEFDLLGVPFAGRGARYEDALRALRAAFGRTDPSYAGSHYRFRDFVVDPCSVQSEPPIWVGGRSPRSLRRALLFGDGWNPFGLDADELRTVLARARSSTAWRDRHTVAKPFDVVLTPEPPLRLDTAADVESARATVRAFAAIGATALNVRFDHRSAEHLHGMLERFSESVFTATD